MAKSAETASKSTSPDAPALLRIWQTERAVLTRTCRRWARGSGSDAEDLLSEAMVRALEHGARRGSSLESPQAWVSTTIANLGRDRMRRGTREVLTDPEDVPLGQLGSTRGLDERLHARRELEALFGSDCALTSAERHILLGRCLGETYADLAKRLRLTECAARKLAQRARDQLKAKRRGASRRA